jgi:hypothetical protein
MNIKIPGYFTHRKTFFHHQLKGISLKLSTKLTMTNLLTHAGPLV